MHGTEGSYLKWEDDPQEEAMKQGIVPGSEAWGTEPESAWGKINSNYQGSPLRGTYPTLPGNYLAFYDNVYEAIQQKRPLEVLPEQARNVIRIIEAAYESSREGKVVTLE